RLPRRDGRDTLDAALRADVMQQHEAAAEVRDRAAVGTELVDDRLVVVVAVCHEAPRRSHAGAAGFGRVVAVAAAGRDATQPAARRGPVRQAVTRSRAAAAMRAVAGTSRIHSGTARAAMPARSSTGTAAASTSSTSQPSSRPLVASPGLRGP